MAAPTDYIAFYKLENNANDETGNYNGTNNGVSFDGQSASFSSATDSYVSTPLNNIVNGNNHYSVTLWFKTNGNVGSYSDFLIGNGSSTAGSSIGLGTAITTSNNILIQRGNGSSSDSTNITDSAYNDGVFHYLSIIYDGTNLSFSIDNISQKSMVSTLSATNNNMMFGTYYSGANTNEFFDGNLSNIRFYDRVITESEISDIYNEEYSKFHPSATASVSVDTTGVIHKTYGTATASVSVDTTGVIHKTYGMATASVSVDTTGIPTNNHPTDYIAYYKLTSNANDETGNYNGINNGVTFDTGFAYFNGNSYIKIPDMLLQISNGYSISFWAKKTVDQYQHILGFQEGIDTYQSVISIPDTRFFYNEIPQYGATVISNTGLSDTHSVLHHFVVNRLGPYNSLQMYIDNSQVSYSVVSDTLKTYDLNLGTIGADLQESYLRFTGNIVFMRIYDRSLTSNEISDIYNEEYNQIFSYKNVRSIEGFIDTLGTNGYAKAQKITQDAAENDFTSVNNTICKFKLKDINSSNTIDTLETYEQIEDNNNIVILKDDNTIHEIIANGVTGTNPYTLDISSITNGSIPKGAFRNDESIFFNDIESQLLYNTFIGVKNYLNEVDPLNDGSGTFLYRFSENMLESTNTYNAVAVGSEIYTPNGELGSYYSAPDYNSYIDIPGLGSWFSGKSEFTLYMFIKESTNLNGSSQTFSVTPPTNVPPYTNVKIKYHNNDFTFAVEGAYKTITLDEPLHGTTNIAISYYGQTGTAKLYVDGLYKDYISGVVSSLGETHDHAMFGRIPSTNSTINAEAVRVQQFRVFNRALTDDEIYDISKNELHYLFVDKTFDTVSTPGRSIEPKVQMSATGNKMTQLDFDIYKSS